MLKDARDGLMLFFDLLKDRGTVLLLPKRRWTTVLDDDRLRRASRARRPLDKARRDRLTGPLALVLDRLRLLFFCGRRALFRFLRHDLFIWLRVLADLFRRRDDPSHLVDRHRPLTWGEMLDDWGIHDPYLLDGPDFPYFFADLPLVFFQ